MQVNFTININEKIVKFLKSTFKRRNAVVALAVAAIGTSVLLYAAVTKPYTFTPLTTISSSEVNANFDAIFEKKGMLIDNNDQILGQVVNALESGITVISSSGYMYKVNWDGSIGSAWFPSTWYYTSSDCTGTAYAYCYDNYYGKVLFYHNTQDKFYIPGDVDTDGTIGCDSITYSSNRYDYGTGSCNTNSSNMEAVAIQEISQTDAGIPATITPPLTIY